MDAPKDDKAWEGHVQAHPRFVLAERLAEVDHLDATIPRLWLGNIRSW